MSNCWDTTRNFDGFQNETHIVVVPTYIKDKVKYCNLVSSFIRSRTLYSDRILFVTVFSSERERDVILHNCRACYNVTNIIMTSLIFDVTYDGSNKFNYQSAKKIWAVAQLPSQSKVVVVDSDCLFVNPTIDMREQMGKIINTMYRGSKFSKDTRDVFASATKLIGSVESDHNIFTLPWLVQPFHVRNLIEHLRIRLLQIQPSLEHVFFDNRTNSNYMNTMRALALYSERVFEVVISNKFILKTDPTYFREVSVPSTTFQPLFESLSTPEERAQIHPPIIALTREHLQRGNCCPECWIMYHVDRTCGMPHDRCYGERIMQGFDEKWLNIERSRFDYMMLLWVALPMLLCVLLRGRLKFVRYLFTGNKWTNLNKPSEITIS